MKKKLISNHAVQESILLLLFGGALIWYAMDARSHSFNKDWSQSPYLFPVLVSVLLLILALSLLIQGISAVKKEEAAEAKAAASTSSPLSALVVAGISLVYYGVLAWVKLPAIAFTVASLYVKISTFEVATFAFLLAMMRFLGEKKSAVLLGVSLGATVFLSIVFRSMLHVLLP